ncbi:MAG: hypothetical protein JST58_03750 [Bacteroidetes bacterium]|nr:hypothetical protein [Bacteroidota bacterium]
MQTDNYRENLKEALKNLIRVNESIYGSIIDVSMQGDLKEFNDAVPIGEVHQLDYELFKNSDDTNVQLLIKLIETVDETFESIKNINSIKLDEE